MSRTRPWVLGIGSSYHNGAACLLHGDELIVGVQEERLLRIKRAAHPAGRPSLAVQYCLDYAGIGAADLSSIGVSRLSGSTSRDDVRESSQLRPLDHGVPVFAITHHRGHATAAFATSGFQSAAILVIDGRGSPLGELAAEELETVLPAQRLRYRLDDALVCETLSIYEADATSVRPVVKHVARATQRRPGAMRDFFSLGSLFLNVGAHMFGESLDGAGKVMGLAPYGTPALDVSEFFTIVDGEFVFSDAVVRRFDTLRRWPQHQDAYADLAASVQHALEEAVLATVSDVKARVASRRLCYAGGVALNSVANERVVHEGGFDEVFIMPAAEDSGTALGAAYHALWQLTREHNCRRQVNDNIGRRYASHEISRAVADSGFVDRCRTSSATRAAAALLARGDIVGWFQGGSELGPRALGQRSILADPRRSDIKALLNERVKFREAFRPYAPAVLLSCAAEWFECDITRIESPFMLRVMKVRPERRAVVPGIVHVDGTARVQTVSAETSPEFAALLESFHSLTGVPILLNTSFNIAGEPIVETPSDALWCFAFSGLDACVLGDILVRKRAGVDDPFAWRPVAADEWRALADTVPPAASTPEHLDVRRLVISVRAEDVTDASDGGVILPGGQMKVSLHGRWGPVTHLLSREAVIPLRFMTGEQTMLQVLHAVNRIGLPYSRLQFTRLLAHLAGIGLLSFRIDEWRRADHVEVEQAPGSAVKLKGQES